MEASNRLARIGRPWHVFRLRGGAGAHPFRPRSLWRAVASPQTIRARLIRILVVSLALVITLLGVGAAQQVDAYQQASATVREVKLLISLQNFVHEHQKERGLTDGLVSGTTSFRAQLPAQRRLTDATLAAVRQLIAGRHDAASDSVREGLRAVDRLDAIRSAADSGHGELITTYDYFTDTNKELTHLTLGLEQAQDPVLRNGIQVLLAFGNAKEATGEERALMTGSLPLGRFPADWYTEFTEARATRAANFDSLPLWTTPQQQARINAIWTTSHAKRMLAWDLVAAQSGGRLDNRAILNEAWYKVLTETINDMRTVQISLGDDITARAQALQQQAQDELTLFALLALGTIVLLGGLAVGAARSVSAPLTALVREAAEVAGGRLPEAVASVQSTGAAQEPPAPVVIPKHAGSEVRLVAEAFDRVQRVAFDLATEQAVLRRNATESLVSLGRRNQNLVRRQISFINKLEHEDADPATLANLFELDHLATRMRRNAESLLVLAGESSPRPWATPLPVTDVVRAALSEVEEYQRVQLRRVDPVHISGSVVAEVAHLLAELIENALNFSPPSSEVEIEGRKTSAGYLLAIVDHGMGMDAQSLAEANVRLSGTASFMAEPTRFLGHFVIGALARRNGIEVRLGDAPATGVVARVLLPAALLSEGSGAAAVGKEAKKGEAPAPRSAVAKGAAELVSVALPADGSSVRELTRSSAVRKGSATAAATASATAPAAPMRRSTAVASAAAAQDGVTADGPAGTGFPASAPQAGPASAARDEGTTQRGSSASRTRNGLVRRPRRSSIPQAVHETAEPRWQASAERTPDRTPDEVSGMLSTLRSAHMRGAISAEKEKWEKEKRERIDTPEGGSAR